MTKARLTELSIIAPSLADGVMLSAALTPELAVKAYRGEWAYTGEDMTVLALAGCIPPTGNGELFAEIPPQLSLPIPSAWSAVYASEPEVVSSLWPEAVNIDELLTAARADVTKGENWLALLSDDFSQNDWQRLQEACFAALREKRIGWITLYPCNGEVWQWNRTALRTGVKALLGRGSGT